MKTSGCSLLDRLKSETNDKTTIRCNVAIVGGGIAGIYMAYKLSSQYGDCLCLIEKENYFGGRIRDIGIDDLVIGTGALRVTKQHPNMMVLANKFNLVLQTANSEIELLKVKPRLIFIGGP